VTALDPGDLWAGLDKKDPQARGINRFLSSKK